MTTPIERLARAYPTVFDGTELQWSDCPPGWESLVASLCERLVAEHPTVRCRRCKPKFGALHFYVDAEQANAAVLALVAACAMDSMRVCEECGAPGRTMPLGGWITTVCPAHQKALGKKRDTPG